MPWTSPTVSALAIALAFSLAVSATASATSDDAAHQRLVRATIAGNPGSVRVGPNQIQLEPGLIMTLRHREPTRTAQARNGSDCHYGYFCIWEHKGLTGASLAMSACKTYILAHYGYFKGEEWVDWAGEASSWRNNQSGGAVATLRSDIGTWFKAPIGSGWYIGDKWNDGSSPSGPAERRDRRYCPRRARRWHRTDGGWC